MGAWGWEGTGWVWTEEVSWMPGKFPPLTRSQGVGALSTGLGFSCTLLLGGVQASAGISNGVGGCGGGQRGLGAPPPTPHADLGELGSQGL